MIHYVTGDIFNSPAQTLVNPVNTVGVMGDGIPQQISAYLPEIRHRL